MEGKLYQINYQVGYFIINQTNPQQKEIKLTKAIICINGLTGHLYNNQLFNRMTQTIQNDYLIILTQLRSSGSSFGMVTLQNDVEDLDLILQHLTTIIPSLNELYLLGHSTGCQDIVKSLEMKLHYKYPIKKCILQAPVSDRDSMRGDKDIENEIKRLETLYNVNLVEIVDKLNVYNSLKQTNNSTNNSENEENEKEIYQLKQIIESKQPSQCLYCNEYFLMQRRFISLFVRRGEDDYFSEDFTNEEFQQLFSCLTIPCLFIFSLNDQYIPQTQEEYQILIQRMKNANENISIQQVYDDHEVSHSLDVVIDMIIRFISQN